jgi:hypothetical protein
VRKWLVDGRERASGYPARVLAGAHETKASAKGHSLRPSRSGVRAWVPVVADHTGDTVSADLPPTRPDTIKKVLHPVVERDAVLFAECNGLHACLSIRASRNALVPDVLNNTTLMGP